MAHFVTLVYPSLHFLHQQWVSHMFVLHAFSRIPSTHPNFAPAPCLPHFLLVELWARARAKQPVLASCPYLHVAMLSLPLSGIVPM